MHDEGIIKIEGKEHKVVNCEKHGKCTIHVIEPALDEESAKRLQGSEVSGKIDKERRLVLRNHHTGTHIVFASCKRVLGPHVWQQGAKKTVEYAHLDITHYDSLTKEQEAKIEAECNKIILQQIPVKTNFVEKSKAEQLYGYTLYQGGIVPEREVRVVEIEGVDVEACCGTHCSNTSQVGWIKILKSSRISDGIVRLYYVAGTKVLERVREERDVIDKLAEMWSTPREDLVETGEKFFKEYKRLSSFASEMERRVLAMHVKVLAEDEKSKRCCVVLPKSLVMSLFIGSLPSFLGKLKVID